jgi:hypothetical protein
LALANAEFVGCFAGSRQSQRNGLVAAFANTSLGHALERNLPSSNVRFQTRESGWALFMFGTIRAAEPSLTIVFDAGRFAAP